ncbi:uncharacterized protein LOC107481844 [Arachis duranensis]|uniref:CAAX prenyl protease 2/Lysostaphin resistance protein A-like domain-containing protein n=2 Tax=Arachis TaxID=3817 RepID=A0A444ZU91_ARAHY|nr:uncharacterized protein LOC107481844 [Arachis duranensis]XP_025691043.1 uncharacterized protein LOC112792152 [Arachis hypogaea]QHO03598.1 uncharacterized protein DS421_13g433520 [Arachis hypogaea]RYR17624.1 hypothetical protein Ahy_B03g062323 [Arachis hypogaea]
MATVSLPRNCGCLLNSVDFLHTRTTYYSSTFITCLTSRRRYSRCSFAKNSTRNGGEAVRDEAGNEGGEKNSKFIASRSGVLQACTITSALIAALGVAIRQVSHVASAEGLPILDCSSQVSFGFEMWHLELITGLVVFISSSRYLLLNTWTDFADSSQAANLQVLSSLQPLDYMFVAFLPGISEELLFRGAILPLFGMNLNGVGVAALIFGVLHLGNGRKSSFAIWATFVGLAYGYATILSSSLVIPMASHALNNLIGGLLWRYTSNASSQK